VYFKLGNIAYKRLDRDAAGRMWRQALQLNPGHELARANLDAMSAPA
jgi:Flp pilus assembly protein TadD